MEKRGLLFLSYQVGDKQQKEGLPRETKRAHFAKEQTGSKSRITFCVSRQDYILLSIPLHMAIFFCTSKSNSVQKLTAL